MPSLSPATGLTITNPLVLYRTLVATKQIKPDRAQHRLAIHLQKLYLRLKDYSPEVNYSDRLDQLSRAIGSPLISPAPVEASDNNAKPESIFSSLRTRKQNRDVLALTKTLTDHESVVNIQSPQGLLLHGEVGTGKSMLVDLLADCLPNQKKRRWHFNTFMLETFARLEQLRRKRLDSRSFVPRGTVQDEEHSLLCLARDMISTSPILFLDEFQLPDRAASKILSTLFTSFFQLGGVLIATSNRMPEELANASGVEFAVPPSTRLGWLGNRWGLLASGSVNRKSENVFPLKGDFAAFLEVLRARCEVWDIEGEKDWRRREAGVEDNADLETNGTNESLGKKACLECLEPVNPENGGLGYEQSRFTESGEESKGMGAKDEPALPKHYFVTPRDEAEIVDDRWETFLRRSVSSTPNQFITGTDITWETTSLHIYGRNVIVPCHLCGVTKWNFHQLCNTNLGPADYISLASTFHTFILTDIPILTLLQKNEARRFITLLDALYEARCKLLIRAEAGPDHIFFPETEQQQNSNIPTQGDSSRGFISGDDETYPETFSEIYQDQTSPFRPNVSSYSSSASPPSYQSSPLPSPYPSGSPSTTSTRSVLTDEDSDFGLVHYGASHSLSTPPSSSSTRGPSDGAPGAGNGIDGEGINFARTGTFTGEDEKFAYKRARSRLWEMCGARWWARQGEAWWRPVPRHVRRWEKFVDAPTTTTTADENDGTAREIEQPKRGEERANAEEKEEEEEEEEEKKKQGAMT
ncbi:hypothetical protein MMC29_005930, partial [Sticta canariensis]|nr:hypothetical protein [Sticta canariensis]